MTALDDIAHLVKETIGVDVATVGQTVIRHAVKTRMAARGVTDVQQYARQLPNSEAEIEALIEVVVVPETWFFRDEKSFEALAEIVKNEWLLAHPGGVLRVLSVPCSSGEEPYSIAMTLLDAGLPARHFTIDAVDVSAAALAHARKGVYGRNSFRGRSLEYRDRYFQRTPEGHKLNAEVAKQVRFQRGNLLDVRLLAQVEPYDIIFCRNVLIYFDGPTQACVVKTLARLLAADGTLFAGPSEAFLVRQGGFTSAPHPGAFAARKASAPSAKSPAAPPVKKRRPVPAITRARKPEPPPAAPPPAPAITLEAAHALADAGRMQEAEAACEELLRHAGASAGPYFLLGLIHDALGHAAQATDYYRKVVYLEPEHPEALLHLAYLAEKRGDRAGASRLQQRARRTEEAAPR